MTAFGRLGSWFASPSYGIEPDLITTAKGLTSGYLPLGAVLASSDVGATIKDAETGFMHGYTYCGHPVACAVALRNLDIIEHENLAANAITVGARLLNSLQGLLELPVVGDVRGAGLLASVELVADKNTKQPLEVRRQEIADRVRDEQGVIVRSIYQNVIIAPCLVLTPMRPTGSPPRFTRSSRRPAPTAGRPRPPRRFAPEVRSPRQMAGDAAGEWDRALDTDVARQRVEPSGANGLEQRVGDAACLRASCQQRGRDLACLGEDLPLVHSVTTPSRMTARPPTIVASSALRGEQSTS